MITRREDSIVTLKKKKEQIKELEAKNAELELQVTDLQLALCDVYELLVPTGGGGGA